MYDKYGYDDLFWVYPPDFVLKAEKKSYFYKFCASFCLRLRFDYDSRVLPKEDPDPLISRRPLSMPELVNRPKSSRSLSSSTELNKNPEFEPNENQMNFDEAPLDETKGISDRYKAEAEPETDAISLQPDDKHEECNDDFQEVPLTNKLVEEECDDDFKEVIFTNKPDEVTDDDNTLIDHSASEKDNRLEVSQSKVQTEENDVANEWHSNVIASTPNDCTDLISDAKFYSDEEGDNNNAGDIPEALTDKKDTESLKVDKDDHLNENPDVIEDTDNEKDKIEVKTDVTPVQVPQTVESGDISEKKDHAVDNPKEEEEGKGARRKHVKKKGKKKSKKLVQKEKSTNDPIPQQDFAAIAQTIVKSKDTKDATKSRKRLSFRK